MTNAVDYKAGQAAYEADVAMRPTYPDGTFAVDYKAGQVAYEADVAMRPTCHDGTPRTPWHKLASYAQWSWSRTDTDYGR